MFLRAAKSEGRPMIAFIANTNVAIALGRSLPPSEIPALQAELAATRAAFGRLDRETDADIEEMIALSFRSQMLRECYESATVTGSIGELLRRTGSIGQLLAQEARR